MTPLDLLLNVLVISLFCVGLDRLMQENMILHFARKFFERQKGIVRGLLMPVCGCVTCFASVWGSAIFIALNGISVALLPDMVVVCVSVAFLNTYFRSLYD